MHLKRSVLIAAAIAVLGLALHQPAQAQGGTPLTVIHDASALKPPPGVRVAVIEFADMECPVCGHDNPLLMQAIAKYNIPWIRHDFPLPYHHWSKQAAVNARWFDTQSKKAGDDYRDYIFANQIQITTPADLQAYTNTFANSRKLQIPFAMDPQGKFLGEVMADLALGQRIGVEHTPTVWIVTNGHNAPPYIEVQDFSHLYQILDEAIAATKSGK